MSHKTAKIVLYDVKSNDWGDLCNDLGHEYGTSYNFFDHGDSATIELEIDKNFNIIGGKIIQKDEK